MTEVARAKNYTDEMVAHMTEAYVANPTRETVEALAAEMGKTVRTVSYTHLTLPTNREV